MPERSGRVSNGSSDDCVTCHTYVEVGISCDNCYGWFHNKCSGLNSDRIAFYKKTENKEVNWFCFSCTQNIHNNFKTLSDTFGKRMQSLENRLDNYDHIEADLSAARNKIKDLESRLDKYEKELLREREVTSELETCQKRLASENLSTISVVQDLAVENAKVTDLVVELVKKQSLLNSYLVKLQQSVEDMSKRLTERVEPGELEKRIITEVENRAKRSRNLLLLNVKEPIEATSFRRRETDKSTAVNIINSLGIIPVPHIVKVHRVGKWSIDRRECRPLLVELETMYQRDRVLECAHLVDKNRYSVKIKGDYTNYQQNRRSNKITPKSCTVASGNESKNGVRPRVNRVA
jgi:hypothetical protein